MATKSLGKNLNILLSNTKSIKKQLANENGLQKLSLDLLQPGKYQPRKDMDQTALNQLADSIRQQGIIQPIAIRQIENGRYEIIAGERRFRAARLAGLSEVPVIVHDVNDETAMGIALIENIQREDLNPMDEARALARLADEFDLTHQQIAELVSKSRTAVTNFLRLMQLEGDVKRLLEHGDIEMGHARALLSLEPTVQLHVAKLIVSRGLSVRETESLINRLKKPQTIKEKEMDLENLSDSKINKLATALKTKVQLKHGAKGKGKLIIHYDSIEKLDQLMAQFDKS
jgi:ParB family transcriptional regulator, chromosome partitioning protein